MSDLEMRVRKGLTTNILIEAREKNIIAHYCDQIDKGRMSLNVAATKAVNDIYSRKTYGVA